MPTNNQQFSSYFPLLCNIAVPPVPHKNKHHNYLLGHGVILICFSLIYTQSIFHFPADLVQGIAFQSCALKIGSLVCCMCLLAEITEGNPGVMATVGA